jgi:hypothetical protein
MGGEDETGKGSAKESHMRGEIGENIENSENSLSNSIHSLRFFGSQGFGLHGNIRERAENARRGTGLGGALCA